MRILSVLLSGILIVWLLLASWVAIPNIVNEVYQEPEIAQELASGSGDSREARLQAQWEFLKDFGLLINYADVMGYTLVSGEIHRTMYQQRHYVSIGRSWTYNSYHIKRRAGDLFRMIDGKMANKVDDYRELGEYWKSLNTLNKWGGDWTKTPDPYHFERR